MVWQKNIQASNGAVDFWTFFMLFIPSVVNWLVPAIAMSFAVQNGRPEGGGALVSTKRGAVRIVLLFLLTALIINPPTPLRPPWASDRAAWRGGAVAAVAAEGKRPA